jgi:hypothetical protein
MECPRKGFLPYRLQFPQIDGIALKVVSRFAIFNAGRASAKKKHLLILILIINIIIKAFIINNKYSNKIIMKAFIIFTKQRIRCE